MGDLESLLLVLLALYGLECLVWVALGSVAVAQWRRHGPWRLWQPSAVCGNRHGGFRFGPPLGTVFVARQFPVSLSPDAALAFVAPCLNPSGRPAQSGICRRWEEMQTVAADRRWVTINGQPFLKAGSTYQARHVATVLRQLAGLSRADRGAAIRTLWAQSLDRRALTERLEEFQRHSQWIRWLARSVLLGLFVLGPLLLWNFGLKRAGLPVLAGLIAQTIPIALLFRRAHAALFPEASDERFTQFLVLLLAPPTAARADNLLARPLLERFHPLTAAGALCGPEEFAAFARRVLLDVHFPVLPACPVNDPVARAAEEWSRTTWREAVEQSVRQAGLELEKLLAPPLRRSPEDRAYCPRCGEGFVTLEGACVDCGGRALHRFETRPPA